MPLYYLIFLISYFRNYISLRISIVIYFSLLQDVAFGKFRVRNYLKLFKIQTWMFRNFEIVAI